MLDGAKPDLVLSGVNRGNNAAENVLYSGTIGGAMEAALQGVPAIALSQFFGPGNVALDDPFEARRVHGAARGPGASGQWALGRATTTALFYNVNFPPVPAADSRGHPGRAAGLPPRHRLSASSRTCRPRAAGSCGSRAAPQHTPTLPGTDAAVNLDGFISVTPMRADLTAHDLLADLEARLA